MAIGGNSLIRAGETGSIGAQLRNARATAAAIIELLRTGLSIVVTHGNGPQVGAALLRSERASDAVYPHSLEVCNATTQGEIGHILSLALREALLNAGQVRPVAAVVTHVVIDESDPAMRHPTKPIGPFMSRDDAEERRRRLRWCVMEDAGRGFRRVVPSPQPIEIVELDVIRALLQQDVVVIAAGGGGIPVARYNETLRGVEAVIDKDRASGLLASELGAGLLVISTDADAVCLDFGRRTERSLGCVTAAELAMHYRAGQFPPGSMGPKVEASLQFLERGGREAIITSPALLPDAIRGRAGTRVTR